MTRTIEEHYAQPDLLSSITSTLEKMGHDLKQLTPEDLAPVDEFHIRGRAATEELFELTGFTQDMKVLDVGSGIGGPARFLAATRGCRVVGIDLTDDYCRFTSFLSAVVAYICDLPPSTTNSVPTTYDESFDAKNSAALATSSAVPMRFIGICSDHFSGSTGNSNFPNIGVSMVPTLRAFTRMFR